MLIKMEISNFKSFKNRTAIDFCSTNYKILKDTNTTSDGILKGAIFVGGNATGKTNVILALRILLDLLFREKNIDLASYKCLFSGENTISLSYEFKIEESTINYNIDFNVTQKTLMEKLLLNNNVVLDRIGKSGKSDITENQIHDNLDNQTLLLRTIYFNTKFNNYPILKKWFDYLINSVYLDASVRVVQTATPIDMLLDDYLEDKGVEEINSFFEKYNFQQLIEYSEKCAGNMISIDLDGKKGVFFRRNGINEPIPYAIESLGNRNLLNMLPAFFHVIQNGGMLIIDEFSSAFHNELEELLVKYFMEKSKRSQMFLVSHSTNLLSNTIFRPDQEYAVEFWNSEGSTINRFSNEKPREAQNIEKMYNSGAFGGIPVYEHV